jgi:hypothetical protein
MSMMRGYKYGQASRSKKDAAKRLVDEAGRQEASRMRETCAKLCERMAGELQDTTGVNQLGLKSAAIRMRKLSLPRKR